MWAASFALVCIATFTRAQKEGDFVSLTDAVTGDALTRKKVHSEMAELGNRVDQMEEKLEARVGAMMGKMEGVMEKSMDQMMKRLEGDISSARLDQLDVSESAKPVLHDGQKSGFCPGRVHQAVRGAVYRNHTIPGLGLGPKGFTHGEKNIHPQSLEVLPYSICHGRNAKSCVDKATPPPFVRLAAEALRKTGQMHDERRLDLASLYKSRKSMGNVHRFRQFLCKLLSGEPTRTLVVGGSNCQNAYLPVDEFPWPHVLEEYLNENFPVVNSSGRHTVLNRGQGGQGTCVISPRMHHFIGNGSTFDLVLSEFAINDAQFAEQQNGAASPMGDHYSQIAECTEVLIRNLLMGSETVAVVLLELPAWSLKFSTAGEV
jgi:hypothetical protein